MMRFRRRGFLVLFGSILFFPILSVFFGSFFRLYAFSDEFSSSLDIKKWNIYENGGKITVDSGILRLYKSGESDRFPYISSTNEFDFPIGHKLSIRYRVLVPYNYGAGIVFGDVIIPNGQTKEDYHNDTYLHIWPQDQDGNIGIFSIKLCGRDESDCSRRYKLYKLWSIDGVWRELILVHNPLGVYEVYDDNRLLFVSRPISPVISNIFFGNPEITPRSKNIFPTIEIDYIRVGPVETKDEKDKIIFLPGMFASWNYAAVVNGESGESWKVPEWIKTYDNLLASLKNAGYVIDEDLFIFPYDWRKGLFDLSDDLNGYVGRLRSQNKLGNGEQFDLVGHSFGGLVARAYEYEYGDELVDQIVAIGSPNLGVTQTYGAWEGLESWNTSWWQSQAIQLLVRFNQVTGELPIETLRRLTPSIRDMLPVYDFLNKDGQLLQTVEMSQQNTSLPGINSGDYKVEVIVGKDKDTIDQLKIKQRSKMEELLGLWEDGKPVEKLAGDGDGTVLNKSARAGFADYSELEADHGELVYGEEGIKTLLGRLGLSQTAVVANKVENQPGSALVAVLRSPGRLRLLDSSGNEEKALVDGGGKILWLPGALDGEYRVEVAANGETGDYELHLGYIGEEGADWEVYFGELSRSDETDGIEFELDEEEIEIVSQNERSGGSKASGYLIDELMSDLNEAKGVKSQLRILRQIKFWSHRLYNQYTYEGNYSGSDEVSKLLDDYDRWSEEIIKDAGYEIKKQQVNGQRRLVINLEKTMSRWKWYTRDLSKAREKLQIAEDYYRNRKYALADEYYYSAWSYLNDGWNFKW